MTPEQKTQLTICEWVKAQHPEVHSMLIKIDNEGKRTLGMHVLAKRMGLQKGASDLFIAYPVGKFHGMFLEIKPDGWKGAYGIKAKRHLEDQMNFIEKMKKQGYHAALGVGIDECIDLIKKYLKPKKE